MMRHHKTDLELDDRLGAGEQAFGVELHSERHTVHVSDRLELRQARNKARFVTELHPSFEVWFKPRIVIAKLAGVVKVPRPMNFSPELAFPLENIRRDLVVRNEPAIGEQARASRHDPAVES